MKAVVFHGIGDIRLDNVAEPEIEEPTDAIVRITSAAICGTDLHMVRGTLAGMEPGTILGHEAVGTVEKFGPMVRNFDIGDRVVILSTIACGHCSYCRAGYFAQCDNANPNRRLVIPVSGLSVIASPTTSPNPDNPAGGSHEAQSVACPPADPGMRLTMNPDSVDATYIAAPGCRHPHTGRRPSRCAAARSSCA